MFEFIVQFAKSFSAIHYTVLGAMTLVLAVLLGLLSSSSRLLPNKESYSNILSFIVRSYFRAWILGLLAGIYSYTRFAELRLFDVGRGFMSFALCLVLYDFLKFICHVLSHKLTVLRLSHMVHHTGTVFDVTTSLRVPLMLYELLFILPCFILGFPVDFILCSAIIQLLYGILVHIDYHHPALAVVEPIFITPRLHKIHHSRKVTYNQNFGFIFSVWDRIFKTYNEKPSLEEIQVGLENIPGDFNPLMIQLRPYINYFKSKFDAVKKSAE